MKAELINELDKCPDDCEHLAFEIDGAPMRTIEGWQTMKIYATCEHLDVCKLREE